MSSLAPKLRLLYHYDLLCLHSYYGYQILQQKLPQLQKKHPPLEIQYIPVFGPKLFRCAYGSLYDGVIAQKREYISHELDLIADLYGLEKTAKFEWTTDLLKRRSVSALMFLTHLKREEPKLYEPFLREFWKQIWVNDFYIDKISRIFKIGRELGVEFRVMDDLISKIESVPNVKDLLGVTNSLTRVDALATPWIDFGTEEKCFVTSEITKLELLKHFIDHPEHLPARRVFPEDRKLKYASPKSTFFEDYSC